MGTQWGNTCKEQHNPSHQTDSKLDERLIRKEFHTIQSQDQEEKSKSWQEVCCYHHGSGQDQFHCRTKADHSSAQGMEMWAGNGVRSHRNNFIFFFLVVFSFFQIPLGVIPDWEKKCASNYLSLSRTDTLSLHSSIPTTCRNISDSYIPECSA